MKFPAHSYLATLVATALMMVTAQAESTVPSGQTKYLEPAKPAVAPAPAPESKGFFSFLGIKKRDSKPAAVETKAAPKPAAKPAAKPAPKQAVAKTAPPVAAPPVKESKGILGFFGLGKKAAAPEEKPVAKAQEKKGAPKPGEAPAKPDPSKTAQTKAKPETQAAPEPKKPGFFSRLFGGKIGEEDHSDDDAPKPPRPVDWDKKYIVTESNVGAYRYGPSQTRDADEYLSKGTVVTLKKGGKAWSDIALENGHIFTVGADQIRPAKESDFAAPPPPVIATGQPFGPDGGLMPVGDLEPIPTIDLPETQAQPRKALEATDLILPALPPP
jgi:hypothetical protein